LRRYGLNDPETVPAAPVITGITFTFTFHMRLISIVRSLYLKIFSASLVITLLSPHIAPAINTQVPFFIGTNYAIRFIVRDGSVGLHLYIPQHDHLTFMTCFYQFRYMVIPVFICQILPLFPCIC